MREDTEAKSATGNQGGRDETRGLFRLAVISFVSPVVAIIWAGRKLVRGPGWGPKLVGLSILGNLLFVLVLIVGYFEASNPEDSGKANSGALVAPECIKRSQEPLLFCAPAAESELNTLVPNAIYVAFDGPVRARFEFTDETLSFLEEVTLSDQYGRPWIDANLEDGSLIYSRYGHDDQLDPEVSLRDRDGDGIPDLMIDWKTGTRFRAEQELQWREIVPKENTSE